MIKRGDKFVPSLGLDMNMIKLNYKTLGEGQPIIFLHGLFGMLDNWQTFAKKMADHGLMPILIDQRDHGKSPFTQAFNYHLLAQDLLHFMEDNWIHQAIILGHSMGGKTAMQFAGEYPEMVEKLIVVDIAPKAYHGGHQEIFKALMSIDLAQAQSRQEVQDHLVNSLDEDESTIQFLLKNLQRDKEAGGYRWKMNVDVLYDNYDSILDNIDLMHPYEGPSLFVRGGDSRYILDEDWDNIKLQFTNSSLHTIKGAGHWVHAQAPDALFDVVTEFIGR